MLVGLALIWSHELRARGIGARGRNSRRRRPGRTHITPTIWPRSPRRALGAEGKKNKKTETAKLGLKDHDAGDWPEAGDFTGGKRDRHESADDFQA